MTTICSCRVFAWTLVMRSAAVCQTSLYDSIQKRFSNKWYKYFCVKQLHFVLVTYNSTLKLSVMHWILCLQIGSVFTCHPPSILSQISSDIVAHFLLYSRDIATTTFCSDASRHMRRALS